MNRIVSALIFLSIAFAVEAQTQLSLQQAIDIATGSSYAARMADFSFLSDYWNYRQYKAMWLPSLNLQGTLGNYNRSTVETRDYETGHVSYVDNNSLYNNLSLSINQNLPWADGRLSLSSDISRLDQFYYNQKTYNTVPFLLHYNQPLRRYSSMQWRRKIAPLQFEYAKRNYLETMQGIIINVTTYYFDALAAQSNLKQSEAKYKDLSTLYAKTIKRMELGLVTKDQMLQLELSMLNAKMSIGYNRLSLENRLFILFSYLHMPDYKNIQLLTPVSLPDISVNVADVINKAYNNSTHSIGQRINLLNAEQHLAQTKANNGLQISLQAQVGLRQSADGLKEAYHRLKDNEVVGITFSLPIYDWGLGRGKKRMAQAQLELVRIQADRNDVEFEQDIRTKVLYFNNQAEQCKISRRALEIAEETYRMAYKRYENGALSVTDLNIANTELENAQAKYLSQLSGYWTYYYDIQRITLYDYINDKNIDYDFDEILK